MQANLGLMFERRAKISRNGGRSGPDSEARLNADVSKDRLRLGQRPPLV